MSCSEGVSLKTGQSAYQNLTQKGITELADSSGQTNKHTNKQKHLRSPGNTASTVFHEKDTETLMFLHININIHTFQHANTPMLLIVGPGAT